MDGFARPPSKDFETVFVASRHSRYRAVAG
jgi:hypothetical protein